MEIVTPRQLINEQPVLTVTLEKKFSDSARTTSIKARQGTLVSCRLLLRLGSQDLVNQKENQPKPSGEPLRGTTTN